MAANLEQMLLHELPDELPDAGMYSAEPELIIREQPKSRFRFRYRNEGTTHGVLPGATPKSSSRKKTYPSVEIVNYIGVARIVVSLVTDEPQPKLHAHSLVGKDCSNGICTVQVGPTDMTACFQNLMIEHATKKDSVPILKRRILENQEICNQLGYLTVDQVTEAQAEEKARELAKDMDLSKVRLCFQGYIKDPVSGTFVTPLPQVVSNVIWNINSPHSTTLKICRMDRSSGTASGGEEVYLLCDKVQKDDIEVRFFQVGPNEELLWENLGDFGPTDVHRQYAIVFKTPPYTGEMAITKSVNLQVQLRRRSDGEVSEPKPFTYYPPRADVEGLKRKRFKACPNLNTYEELLKNFMTENGNSIIAPNMNQNYSFGTPTINEEDLLIQHNGVGGHQPITSDPQQLQQVPAVTQPHVPGAPPPGPQQSCMAQMPHHQIPPQQMQQLSPQQQMQPLQPDLQLQQQFVSQGQRSSPEQQKQQHMMMLQQNRQMKQMAHLQKMQQGGRTLDNSQGLFAQQGIGPGQQNYQLQQPQRVLQHGGQQQVQQNGHPKVFGMTNNRPRASLVRKGKKQPPQVKKEEPEPLDCTELKENLPDIDMKSSDSDRFKIPGLELPTNDIRSDATPRPGPCDLIEADSCVTDNMRGHGAYPDRTAEWVKGFGDYRKTPPINEMRCLVEEINFVEKHVQTDSTVDYERELFELGRKLSIALLAYSQTGDVRILLQAQRHLCDINDENGDTPLHLAVIHKQAAALQALLNVVVTIEGQKIIDQKNKLNQTALHLAVILRDRDMVSMLLRCGADPNTLDHQGFNSLHLAVEEGFHEGMDVLIDGPEEDPGQMVIAVETDMRNLDGNAALHMAVMKGDIDAARSLIEHGADKNIPDGKSGRVPLHHAVLTENFTMLSYLVADAKVDIEAEDFAGNTPLHIASAYDLRAVAALLIAAGASPERRNFDTMNESDDSWTDEGCSVDNDDDDDERIGSSPLDYAKSDQMKRVLSGETYIPHIPSAHDIPRTEVPGIHSSIRFSHLSVVDQADSARSQVDSGIRSRSLRTESEVILSLPRSCVKTLSQSLDAPSDDTRDWRAVARSLGMGNMVNHLMSFCSPALVLLEQYALMDGTLSELLQVLQDLRRDDVVEIIQNSINQPTR